jgi:hypothetical protein
VTNALGILCSAVDTGEFEDNGWIVLSAASWGTDDIVLSVELEPGDGTPKQCWHVTCERPRSHRLQSHTANDFAVHEDHVLLLPYQQLQADLYFASPAASPAAVAGELWAAHRRYTDDWFPPETFLNPNVPLIALLATRSGLLAQGPVGILAEYEMVLTRNDIACSQLRERDPKRWDGSSWVTESEVLKVLTIGRSFVVAEAFTGTRADVV